jgi:poly(hydroxyalkanoate) depolymerase family esterase
MHENRSAALWPFAILATLGVAGVGCSDADPQSTETLEIGTVTSQLVGVPNFGPNPAQLTMTVYVPDGMPAGPRPLVVALHGCSQNPDQYTAAGWNELADVWKFYVVYPGQNNGKNNSLGCFNWGGRWPSAPNAFVFTPEPLDTGALARGKDENESIKEMVDKMKADHAVDSSRVFVTGLSAGGGMAAVLLATWPDVFSAGAIMSGIPYGCAMSKKTTEEANNCMKAYSGTTAYLARTPSAWGDLVRGAAAGHGSAFPRVSIWAGTADGTVAPSILNEHVKQWTNVHGADSDADTTNTVDGYPHKEFKDGSGKVVVETYEITGKPHGTMVNPSAPVDPGTPNGPKCGKAGSYIVSAGICSTYYAAKFFGLAPGSDPNGSSTSGGPNGGPNGTSSNGASGTSSTGGAHGKIPGTPYSASSTCSIGVTTAGGTSFGLTVGALALGLAVSRRKRRERAS